MWTLSYAPPTLRVGEQYPVIASFPDYESVVEAVGQIEDYDMDGVWDGHYEIAGEPEVSCYCCGRSMRPNIYGEACYSCMHPDIPREVNPYDTPGAWMDSTFPNEY